MGNKLEKELRARFSSLDPVPQGGGQPFWHLYHGVLKKGNHEVSVFVFNSELVQHQVQKGSKWKAKLGVGGGAAESPDPWDPYTGAKNAVTLLQSVQHPSFPGVVDCFADDDSRGVFFCVDLLVTFLDAARGLCASELGVAIADCARSLQHLHELGFSHNNVSPRSMYFSARPRHRCFMLDLQFAGRADEQAMERLRCSRPLRDPEFGVCPEDDVGVPIHYDQVPASVRDVVGLGRTIRLFAVERRSGMRDRRTGVPQELTAVNVQQSILRWCLAVEASELRSQHQFCLPADRPGLGDLLALPFFSRSTLLSVCDTVDQGIQGAAPPEAYASLHSRLCTLPYDIVRERIVPAVLVEPFWCAPGASTFTCHLLAPPPDCPYAAARAVTSAVGGLLLADGHEQVLEFVLGMLASRRRQPRVAVLRVCDTLCRGTPPDLLVDAVLPEFAVGLSDESPEVVQWSVKGVLAAAKAALCEGVEEGLRARAAAFLNTRVVAELLRRATAPNQPDRSRSAAALGLAELAAVDAACSVAAALPALLHALACSLLHEAEYPALHALNAVVMAERALPYRTIALEVLPLLAPATLHPSTKVGEKAAHVMELLISALGDGGLAESPTDLEEWTAPPLARGCPVVPPPPPADDKRARKERDKHALSGELTAQPRESMDLTRRFSTAVDPFGTPVTPAGSDAPPAAAESWDGEWNAAPGVLSAHHLPLEVARSAQARRTSNCVAVMKACGKGGGPAVEDTTVTVGDDAERSPLPSPKARRRRVRGADPADAAAAAAAGSAHSTPQQQPVAGALPDLFNFSSPASDPQPPAGDAEEQGTRGRKGKGRRKAAEPPAGAGLVAAAGKQGRRGTRRKRSDPEAGADAEATPDREGTVGTTGTPGTTGLAFLSPLAEQPAAPAAEGVASPPPQQEGEDAPRSPRGGRAPASAGRRTRRRPPGGAAAGLQPQQLDFGADGPAAAAAEPAPAPAAAAAAPSQDALGGTGFSIDDLLNQYDPDGQPSAGAAPAAAAPAAAAPPAAGEGAPPPKPKGKVKKKKAKSATSAALESPGDGGAAPSDPDGAAGWAASLHLSGMVPAQGGPPPPAAPPAAGEGVEGWAASLQLSQIEGRQPAAGKAKSTKKKRGAKAAAATAAAEAEQHSVVACNTTVADSIFDMTTSAAAAPAPAAPAPTLDLTEQDAADARSAPTSTPPRSPAARGREKKGGKVRRRAPKQGDAPAAPEPAAAADGGAAFPFPGVRRADQPPEAPPADFPFAGIAVQQQPQPQQPQRQGSAGGLFAGLSTLDPPPAPAPAPAPAPPGCVDLPRQESGLSERREPAQHLAPPAPLAAGGRRPSRTPHSQTHLAHRRKSEHPVHYNPQEDQADAAPLAPLAADHGPPAPPGGGLFSDDDDLLSGGAATPRAPRRSGGPPQPQPQDDADFFGMGMPSPPSQQRSQTGVPAPAAEAAADLLAGSASNAEHPFADVVHSHWRKDAAAESAGDLFAGLSTSPSAPAASPASGAAGLFAGMEMSPHSKGSKTKRQPPQQQQPQQQQLQQQQPLAAAPAVDDFFSPPAQPEAASAAGGAGGPFGGSATARAPATAPVRQAAAPDLSELFGGPPAPAAAPAAAPAPGGGGMLVGMELRHASPVAAAAAPPAGGGLLEGMELRQPPAPAEAHPFAGLVHSHWDDRRKQQEEQQQQQQQSPTARQPKGARAKKGAK
eukprot:TRINITY_DN12008_c0_g1_i6.p1 TRINITY_DN12008_c0_g1~~TRINITY_DN12008_c0_g1_i6.p1  ORF type:complete len:1700 (+),score=486.27 TRINITY_DN12008_c0_g1_i6:155-5254(+)